MPSGSRNPLAKAARRLDYGRVPDVQRVQVLHPLIQLLPGQRESERIRVAQCLGALRVLAYRDEVGFR